MFELFAGPQEHHVFETEEKALMYARIKELESFEVLDEYGYQVHVEFPRPRWA